ncbi:MAG: ribonuclease Y [Candidatus Taylorbacteria bacterium RIFCSPLOWO2_12_FULL_43_20]|uniref:Ribonuclease Y n=1 Tax=Candidatus Taylorbacteria bacterium RIFCSPLOWO2_12_FULL_43_20 TaxID=1802332 RepID=A0A1G2P255_9BACT|nr:MAG: ribonuclease Y [Candidatus Taylorbacteria bacterium RIFCSPHIGHO2_02_FULL_43_55]OHA29865.1 MAG: ribonuclease Y [Candidatus Taylorbacteria bacterium RIFCSPHIGHO2_12_FULL_42_34]OHA31251.1 MAG: ribonuclease Y [Candidatus Taylorbacteria bacterium RIFCSPLOWO2_01_FULL_43_83]OHA39059.1 MAG: ribonuclease Y [Candidatus Taylorbacteria bacterium RIFCSPLOWO2_02_FULL_43_22b]OHA42410.1 MAG: ribonuclease Y [Candidatus Taylorbacteria bacterium RIFCSPLOWO2_12_FULL_43_20]
MSLKIAFLFACLAAVSGAAVGYYLRVLVSLGKKGSMELKLKQQELQAEEKAKKIISDAETKAIETIKEIRVEIKEKEEKLKKTEDRLIKKEDLLDHRQTELDKEVEEIKTKIQEIKKIKEKVDGQEKEKTAELERLSKMSEEEAKNRLLDIIEKKYEEDFLVRMQKLENYGEERLEKKAKDILSTCIQRLGNAVGGDVFSTTMVIPSDELKGKIIGKEGRNIKAFERVTGVEIIVDDTPGSITISSFDPIRRQVARVALENLIADGRIQPAKIEKLVEKAKEDINKTIKDKGAEAAYECGIINLDPRIVHILGRLHFRTSYGQNVLQHSVEMTHIAGMLAEELGANVNVAKAGALLHDIGKAVDHEVQGTHVEIGRRILQKFGASEEIIKAMQAHHEEYPYETIESVIVQVADAISGGRPGARRDSVENYLKRLEDLEGIATSFEGVEKAYALQAGREIRIFVTPTNIDDFQAKQMARDIALKIERELKYPGEIKVTVIRETRVVEFAR